MTETIGKITLNLDKYPGEDYYCDGSVEDEILDIVKKYSTVEYDRIIADTENRESAGSGQWMRSHHGCTGKKSRGSDLCGSLEEAQPDQRLPPQRM